MQTKRAIVYSVLSCALLSACSKQPAQSPSAMPPTPSSEQPAAVDPNAMHGKLMSAGIPSKYIAHFAGGHIERIDEERTVDGRVLRSEYGYEGARLMRYTGSNLTQANELSLEFDARGVLTSRTGEASEDEITSIRTRAQLLRSHALAQHASKHH